MVQQSKKNASTSKTSKSTAATTSSTAQSKVTSSSSTSSTSTTTKSSNVVVDKPSGSQSSVVISEVVGGASHLPVAPSDYIVSQPEVVHTSKEHYIYGGTQIVELSSTIGDDVIHHEKNQTKFMYEGGKPGETIETITSRSAIITEPVGGAETSAHSKRNASDLFGHSSDFHKQATTTSSKTTTLSSQATSRDASRAEPLIGAHQQVLDKSASTRNRGDRNESYVYETTTVSSSDSSTKNMSSASDHKSNTTHSRDVTDSANRGRSSLSSIIESKKLIDDQRQVRSDAHKLSADNKGPQPDGKLFTYVKGQHVADSSDLLLQSERCIAKKAYVTTDDTEDSTESVLNTIRADAEPRRTYPVATFSPPRSTDKSKGLHDTNKSIVESNRGTVTEEFSQSFSTSSTVDKTSSSSQVIEIVDGKERVVKNTFNESGSMQAKSSEEKMKARHGTGLTPVVEYDQKLAEENITFKNDKPDSAPIFDRNYMDAERNVRMLGNDAPVQRTKGTYETTRYDEKTKKYVTDAHHSENDRQLESNRRITDTIRDTTHGLTSIDATHNTYNRQLLDNTTNESQTFNTNVDTSSTNSRNTRLDSKNVIDTSTTYTSKIFDDKTNTWHVTNESTLNEQNVLDSRNQPNTSIRPSKPSHPGPEHRISTTTHQRNNDTSIIASTSDTKTIAQHLYDEKSKTWTEVDEKTIKSKRPSLVRVVSKDNTGKYTTIYKRKIFDRRSGTWQVVDEKVYRNNNFNEHIPEVVEDVTNVTTTTYTTKVFDTKTNTWKVVDEKTFTDRETKVPKDIADELARDQPDIANITTTTELTKVSLCQIIANQCHSNAPESHRHKQYLCLICISGTAAAEEQFALRNFKMPFSSRHHCSHYTTHHHQIVIM